MGNQQSPQIVIIGCGPAGAGTSFFLSNAGIPHTILEKSEFPRDKVCGDACSGKTAFVLRKANAEYLNEIFANDNMFLPSNGIVFAAPNGKTIEIPFHSAPTKEQQPVGFTSARQTFDYFLYQKVKTSPYANVVENVRNIYLKKNEDCLLIEYEVSDYKETKKRQINADLLIGADGDKGISRKTLLGNNTLNKTSAVGLRAYYKGVDKMHQQNFIELHFLKSTLPGYLWVFPLPNGMANVGIGIESSYIRNRKINLRDTMLDALENDLNISHRFKNAELVDKIMGWGLPMSYEKESVSGNRFMLVGDAAQLIDPFTGEGIGNALYSGMLAAEACIKAIKNCRFDANFLHQEYDEILFKRIGPELKLSYTLQRLVRHPWLFNFVVNKAHKSPSLRNTISSMFTDLDIRALLKKPSFYWNILVNK